MGNTARGGVELQFRQVDQLLRMAPNSPLRGKKQPCVRVSRLEQIVHYIVDHRNASRSYLGEANSMVKTESTCDMSRREHCFVSIWQHGAQLPAGNLSRT